MNLTLNPIDIQRFNPQQVKPMAIDGLKDSVFLAIFDQPDFSDLSTLVEAYIQAFDENDSVSLILQCNHPHLTQENLLETFAFHEINLDQSADLLILETPVNETQLPTLLQLCTVCLCLNAHQTQTYLGPALMMNKQVICHEQMASPPKGVICLDLQDTQQLSHTLKTCAEQPVQPPLRTTNLLSPHLPISPIFERQSGSHVFGLGLKPDATPHLVADQMLAFLRQHLQPKETFAVLGAGEPAQTLLNRLAQSPFQKQLWKSSDKEAYFSFEFFGTLCHFYQFYRHYHPDLLPTYYLICTTPTQYLKIGRFFLLKTEPKGQIVMPFLPAKSWNAESFDPRKPIVATALTRSGSSRLLFVLQELFTHLQRLPKDFKEPDFNHRIMHQRRTNIASKPNAPPPQNDPIFNIRHSLIDPNYAMWSETELKNYHQRQLQELDYFEVMYMHLHSFSSVDIFKAHPDINVILLMRDPRDTYISFYFAIIHTAYYHLNVFQEDSGFPEKHKEALILDLIEKGWESISFNKLLKFPSLPQLLDHYLMAQDMDNVYIVRFEDLHQPDPRPIYQDLLNWLGLLNAPCLPDITDEIWDKALYKASFKYRSQGTQTRGQTIDTHAPAFHLMRRGVVGDWKNHFTPKIEARFNKLARGKMAQLGYH